MDRINQRIAAELGVGVAQVVAAVELLGEGSTVPFIARYRKEKTGGLDDTIEAFDPATGRGTGFKFQAYEGAALLVAIRQALAIFRNEPATWRRIQINGMAKDFSWTASAVEYGKLYEAARSLHKT